MPRRMVTPHIGEVSGVDIPAHLAEGWMVLKSANPATAALLSQAEAVSKGQNPSDITGSTDMPKLSKDARAALPADAVAYIESLEKAAAAPAPVATSPEDAERMAFEKALEDVPEAAREYMRKQQRATAEASALAKSLYDAQEDAKFEAFAKSLAHVPNVTVESAKGFRKLAETSPDEWTAISKALVASENALAQSPVFKELGSGHTGTPGTAGETLAAMAKTEQEADTTLSYPEALAKAAEKAGRENPELITQHRTESLRANALAGE